MREIQAPGDRAPTFSKVTDEIRFDMSLLALNAAVETARAERAGVGFAPAAQELRNLLDGCVHADKEQAGHNNL